jgi:enterochelin esterase-like enzyme
MRIRHARLLQAAVFLLAITLSISACAKDSNHSASGTTDSSASAATPSMRDLPAAPADPESSKPLNPSSLERIQFHSEALGVEKHMNIYLPPGYDPSVRYPVLYLLHGYYGTEASWMPDMQLNRTADKLIAEGRIEPLIIAAPEMNNSYGLNSSDTYRVADPSVPDRSRYYGRYEDYFLQDVIPYVEEHYNTVAEQRGRYVGGLSMGGFISLHVAFRHPGLFSKVGGHSPALWHDDWSRVPNMKSWLYPSEEERLRRDPIELANTADLSGMSVYLDCGDQDDFKLYEGTEKVYQVLQSRGIPVEYRLNPGKHNRAYWQSHTEDYLLFYAGIA